MPAASASADEQPVPRTILNARGAHQQNEQAAGAARQRAGRRAGNAERGEHAQRIPDHSPDRCAQHDRERRPCVLRGAGCIAMRPRREGLVRATDPQCLRHVRSRLRPSPLLRALLSFLTSTRIVHCSAFVRRTRLQRLVSSRTWPPWPVPSRAAVSKVPRLYRSIAFPRPRRVSAFAAIARAAARCRR